MIAWLARGGARALLVALLTFSLVTAGWSGLRILRDPLVRPVAERAADEFAAALEREMSRAATPQAVADRLTALLAETPRNWIAITAVEDLAAERGLVLPAGVLAARQAAWDAESATLTRLGDCAACIWNAGRCTLSNALICNAPVTLTPIGDVLGLGRAAVASATGAGIDRFDLTLSLIGLGATAAVLASGGTSYTIKLGASLLKLARRMAILPPRLVALIGDAVRHGVHWDRVLKWDGIADPARLLNLRAVAPVAAVASDLGRINARLDVPRTLHLLRHVDGPRDSRALAAAAEALGPRVVGTIEVLGKSRFMRAALRWTDEALALVAGISGLLVSIGIGLASAVQALLSRRLRWSLGNPRR